MEETSPILVLSAGRAYTVSDTGVQHKINQLVTQQQAENRTGNQHQVYWLGGGETGASAHSEPSSPSLPDPGGVDPGAAKRQEQTSAVPAGSNAPGVNSPTSTSAQVVMPSPNAVLSPILTRPVRKPLVRIPGNDDDGEYATLRDLPLVTLPEEPADMHETSSSSDSSGVDSGFDSSSRQPMMMPAPVNSPRLVSRQRDLCNPYGYVKPGMSTFSSPGNSNTIALPSQASSPANRAVFHSLPLGYAHR